MQDQDNPKMNIPVTMTDPGERNTFELGVQEDRLDHNADRADLESNTSNSRGKTDY